MKIEPNIIDGKTEKEGLYTDTSISTLQERLDTISFQLYSINLQLSEKVVVVSVDEKARLLAQKSELEDEKAELEQKITELKEKEKEESDLESADSFEGSLDKNREELFSAREIGKAYVPKVATTDKKKARKVDTELEKNNDEFGKKAEDMMTKMDDLFI